MKFVAFFLMIGIPVRSFSQTRELALADIIPFTYAFEIIDDQITGPGADTLKSVIANSSFFMLGEEHFSPQISELTNILLPCFASNGYDDMALEVGPFTADIIEKELGEYNTLYKFNNSFYSKYRDIPIPFFDGTADDEFVRTAFEHNLGLWGLDQEYVTAPLFLLDKIYGMSDEQAETREAYELAKSYLEKELGKLNGGTENGYFEMFDSDNAFTQYIDRCEQPGQKEIIDALKVSMEIYKHQGPEGNRQRMEYMKRRFSEALRSEADGNRLPKVVIKMGSMHLGRGKNWLGIYDLGNMIYELASFYDTKAVSVNCFSRYGDVGDGTVYDLKESEKDLSLMLEVATKDKWTLVDAKKIIELAERQKIRLNEELDFLLSRYDYILFAPLKKTVKNNY